jgi:hypothetical protein
MKGGEFLIAIVIVVVVIIIMCGIHTHMLYFVLFPLLAVILAQIQILKTLLTEEAFVCFLVFLIRYHKSMYSMVNSCVT